MSAGIGGTAPPLIGPGAARTLEGMQDSLRLATDATLVLPDRLARGWLAVDAEGRIAGWGEGAAPEGTAPGNAARGRGVDFGGDLLLPGLVELHTDHLEAHHAPRPGVRWHPLAATLAYDAQIAASGITTVFDSLRAGTDADGGGGSEELFHLAEALDSARAEGLLRCDHRTHLRCEVTSPNVLEALERFLERFPVDLVSLMDHTPGQRQFRDLRQYVAYYTRRSGTPPTEMEAMVAEKRARNAAVVARQRPALVAMARAAGVPMASHDDTTPDDVAESRRDGVALAEFPTTLEAARACRDAGITVMMGAPNLVRGGSHSGNVAAETLAREGLLDVLSSDYVPGSLLMAAFELPHRVPSMDLPHALATVTDTPARATGLHDRGRIETGLRADLVRVRTTAAGMPVVRAVWRSGARIC